MKNKTIIFEGQCIGSRDKKKLKSLLFTNTCTLYHSKKTLKFT